MIEEEDEEEYLNSTQNPLEEDTELSVLISTITGDMDNGTWINAKSTTAMAIQAEINLKKKILPVEEQVPKEFTTTWMFSPKKKRQGSLNLGLGITR
jgi:hypothetical protein